MDQTDLGPSTRRSPGRGFAKHLAGSGPAKLAALLFVASAFACAGPPVPTAIEDEPVCPDFDLGATHTKTKGGLHYPVTITIKEGKDIMMRATVLGLREPNATKTRILLRDTNAEYTVEWAQCENERAPRPADVSRETKDTAGYECGQAVIYKTETLATKKGYFASHVLHFPAAPKAACWKDE